MTMQSSGPISIGQARNECGQGNPIDANNALLRRLAGAPSGGYSWSRWYGKTNLAQYNNAEFAQTAQHVDRINRLSVNFRTGAYSLLTATGDGGPGMNFYRASMAPISNIAMYSTVSAANVYAAGTTRMILSVEQQPNAGNDWTAIFRFDDSGPSGQADVQTSLRITALS